MLDFDLRFADHFDDDSSVTTVIRQGEFGRTGSFECPARRSHIDDAKCLAVQRAKYFQRKYFFERFLAGILFVLLSPLMLALIVLVRTTTRGAGIYRQLRVGLHGKEFYVYKIRSMYIDAEASACAVWSFKGDRRITPVGKVLRKSHLDELPQLWNIVKGEMSFTGPRPERPEICDVLCMHIDDYYHRNVIKPGVTGFAQINLGPDKTIADVKRKQYLDMHYIENASVWLDIRMSLATALQVVGVNGEKTMRFLKLCRRSLIARDVVINRRDNVELFP